MKVIFLDRDGVINEYPGDREYVKSLDEFKFIPGSLKALRKLTEAGFRIFVISNQAGVSKGIYSNNDLKDMTSLMLAEAGKNKAKIEAVFYCTHSTEEDCGHRKPESSQIKLILRRFKPKELDLKSTFFVGDSIRDVQAGKKAGLKTVLVLTGKEKLNNNQYQNYKFQ